MANKTKMMGQGICYRQMSGETGAETVTLQCSSESHYRGSTGFTQESLSQKVKEDFREAAKSRRGEIRQTCGKGWFEWPWSLLTNKSRT